MKKDVVYQQIQYIVLLDLYHNQIKSVEFQNEP